MATPASVTAGDGPQQWSQAQLRAGGARVRPGMWVVGRMAWGSVYSHSSVDAGMCRASAAANKWRRCPTNPEVCGERAGRRAGRRAGGTGARAAMWPAVLCCLVRPKHPPGPPSPRPPPMSFSLPPACPTRWACGRVLLRGAALTPAPHPCPSPLPLTPSGPWLCPEDGSR